MESIKVFRSRSIINSNSVKFQFPLECEPVAWHNDSLSAKLRTQHFDREKYRKNWAKLFLALFQFFAVLETRTSLRRDFVNEIHWMNDSFRQTSEKDEASSLS